MIDMRSIDPAMGNNRAVSSGTTRAIDAAGADYGVSFGHRGHHRADRKDSGDRGHDCSLHIKSPSKIALCELQLANTRGFREPCRRWRRLHDIVDTNGLRVRLALTAGETHDKRLGSVLASLLFQQSTCP